MNGSAVRVRGIRLLMFILALTASRNNFPWPAADGLFFRTSSRSVTSLCCGHKRYDGVIPSRRLLESRRQDRVKTTALKAGGDSFRGRQHLLATVVLGSGSVERRSRPAEGQVGPAYLRPFSEASSPIPRPPPAAGSEVS